MAWPRRQLAVSHIAQGPAYRRLVQSDAERVVEPGRQIAQAPAYETVKIGCRPFLHRRRQSLALDHVQTRGVPSDLRSIRPSGPSALNRTTQSRTACTLALA